MIDLKKMKIEREFYLKSFENKGLNLKSEVDNVLLMYDEYLKLITCEQSLRSELNNITKKIEIDSKNNELKIEASKISKQARELKIEISDLFIKINEEASYFPNPAAIDVPIGKNENDNVVIFNYLDEKKNNLFSKPHWDILEEKKIILNNESSYISGARHVVFNDKAALVIKAIEKFMLDEHSMNGYNVVEPPVIVNKNALFNTGQLPKFEEDLFKLENNQYLIPTGEVPLTNLVANKLLLLNQLPIKYVASTQCFRKEAGSAGRDTRGIIRLHQFRKVELVKIGKPSDEKEDLDEILNRACSILQKLELPYRLLQLCTGDSSFSSRKTIDIEVWMPGVNMYREVSSVSSIGDFQSRRMKTRYKNEDGKKEFVYTYNGSGLAIERTFAAILENYIQENGKIKVPLVLQKYVNFIEF